MYIHIQLAIVACIENPRSHVQYVFLLVCSQNAWVPRKLAATNVPTTIDKIHEQAKKEEMEMQKRIASQPMMGWSRGEGPTPSSRIDAEKFRRALNRAAGVS